MPRWEPNAVGRLQNAALELFATQGYEDTTVAHIAERAGLTERSYFNHFATKRDVLFGPGTAVHEQIVTREISGSALGPLDSVVRGLQVAADEVLEELRPQSIRRRALIDATPELQERDQDKSAALTATIAKALRDRHLEPEAALLTARSAVLVQQTAMRMWTDPTEDRSLRELIPEALRSLRSVVEADPSES